MQQLRALAISYDVQKGKNGRRWQVKPGAVDLSREAVGKIELCDEGGNVLASGADGTLRLRELLAKSAEYPSPGVVLEIPIDPRNPDHCSLAAAFHGDVGVRVEYVADTVQAREQGDVRTYTRLAIDRIVLSTSRPDPGTRVHFVLNPKSSELSRRAGRIVLAANNAKSTELSRADVLRT